MAYKDEYEVARLYTDGRFARQIKEQFEGELTLEFYSRAAAAGALGAGKPPRKLRFGAWLLPLLRVLARGKALRGGALDLFGRSAGGMERCADHAVRGARRRAAGRLQPGNLALAAEIARDAAGDARLRPREDRQRGAGACARGRAAAPARPQCYPRPAPSAGQAAQRGIAIVAR